MKWYYMNYFFARQNEMDYPLASVELGHDDTLLNLLSDNSVATAEHRRRAGRSPGLFLRQSFMAAGKAFKAIDAPTRGVIVPHGRPGRALIAELCSGSGVENRYDLLRKAQQYTVNVFPYVLQQLQNDGAVYEIQKGIQILYLDPRYYSGDFGLVTEALDNSETYIV